MHTFFRYTFCGLLVCMALGTAFAQIGNLGNRARTELIGEVKTELDSTILGVKTDINAEIDGFKTELGGHISEVKTSVDTTLADIQQQVKETKSEILGAMGTIVWRFTLIDILLSLITTLVTAYLTAWLTTRRLALQQLRKEMEALLAETRQSLEEVKAAAEALGERE
ncbi:MAG: hypothetical protein D6730_25520 [Bacteroidetes bacterium]|nr:MAG: hypothetical protein D6730_25520 [Bacteroidota bacterium]